MSLDSIPFHALNPKQLRTELWPGVHKWSIPLNRNWPKGRDRGNYVKNYVHSILRIQMQSTRLRVRWSLEAMWTHLPTELISAIFGFLHPLDLYHAVQTTTGVRCFLLSKQAMWIWKESFLNHPDVPTYPDDVSPPKWVSLMFGPATCDICGRDNSLVDYALRIRLCNDCMDYCKKIDDKMTAVIQPILGEFPDNIDDLWRVARKTNRPSALCYPEAIHYSRLPRYSIRQTVEAAQEIRKFLLDIQSGAADAQRRYEVFVDATEEANDKIAKHAKGCNSWAQRIFTLSREIFAESIRPFSDMAGAILVERGHDPKDVSEAQRDFSLTIQTGWSKSTDPRLSRYKLPKYLPMIEGMVDSCKSRRVLREVNKRISDRKIKINNLYVKITRGNPNTPDLFYLPLPETIYKDDFFAAYINDPRDAVFSLDFDHVKPQFLRIIDEFMTAKKRRFFEMLLHAGVLPKEANVNSQPEDYLRLAVAAFECCSRVWFGWEEAGAHQCRVNHGFAHMSDARDSSFTFRFSDLGYQVLKELAGYLHVESLESVLPEDLDVLNRRFVCKSCSFIKQAGVLGQHSLTWRECLTHAVEAKKSNDEHIPAFDILSDALTAHSLFLEEPFPPPTDHLWICKRCLPCMGSLTKSDVIKHIYDVHGVPKPTFPVDYKVFWKENALPRTPLFVGLGESANHRCLRCPRSHKLWPQSEKMPALHLHLKNKHNVEPEDSVEGVDWVKIQAVEDDTWVREKLNLAMQ